MKKKLDEKLALDDRNASWFWKNKLNGKVVITYSYFMRMLDGTSTMRGDVKTEIQKFLDQD